MTSAYKRSASSFLPGYSTNAALQLIIASGVGYVAFLFTAVCFQAFGHYRFEEAVHTILPYIALPSKDAFLSAPWTLLTYGWSHYGFWEWVSNMIWLYCFGGIVQMLVGHREVIPLFMYSLIAAGAVYLLGQYIPAFAVPDTAYVLGAQAGVTALAVAALTLSPKYRLYLNPTFSVSLPLLAGIFAVLLLLRTNLQPPALLMLTGGGLAGYLYIRLLRAGYRPGRWIYRLYGGMERLFTPDEEQREKRHRRRNEVLQRMHESKQGITQRRIDELLDKIGQHGYESLTKEEKEALRRAGGDNG